MDSFPADTATRGGDGVLNTLDLVQLLKRAVILIRRGPCVLRAGSRRARFLRRK